MDRQLRQAQRKGDAPLELSLRIRAGLLTREHVDLAASLGHAVAYALCSDTEQVKWDDGDMRRDAISAATSLWGDTLPARVAADWAYRVLHRWESKHSGDSRPREAIAAAKAWAACPCEDHRTAAADAAYAADAAAYAADAADAAAYAADAAAAEAAAVSASASAAAVFAASAAFAAADASAAAVFAVSADADADADASAAAASARAAEYEWQRLRLAAYLLGEC